jgi:hypothetical protein
MHDPFVDQIRHDSLANFSQDVEDSAEFLRTRLTACKIDFDQFQIAEGNETHGEKAARMELQFLASVMALDACLDRSDSIRVSNNDMLIQIDTLTVHLVCISRRPRNSRGFLLGLSIVQPLSLVVQKRHTPGI